MQGSISVGMPVPLRIKRRVARWRRIPPRRCPPSPPENSRAERPPSDQSYAPIPPAALGAIRIGAVAIAASLSRAARRISA